MRPITAGMGILMENNCIWLDNLLQPLVSRVPGFIEDIKELLKAFYNLEWHKHYLWVKCEVIALYICISHDRTIMALSYHLIKYSNYTFPARWLTCT